MFHQPLLAEHDHWTWRGSISVLLLIILVLGSGTWPPVRIALAQDRVVATHSQSPAHGPSPVPLRLNQQDLSTVQFITNSLTITESVGTMFLTATLDMAAAVTITVQYRTNNSIDSGGALYNVDYASTDGVIIFNPGEITSMVAVPIIDDAMQEGAETFRVELYAGVNVQLGARRWAVITIEDNDPQGEPYTFVLSTRTLTQTVYNHQRVTFTLDLTNTSPVTDIYFLSALSLAARASGGVNCAPSWWIMLGPDQHTTIDCSSTIGPGDPEGLSCFANITAGSLGDRRVYRHLNLYINVISSRNYLSIIMAP